MSTLTGTIQDILSSKATDTIYGLAKVSGATTVTETNNGLVLSAKEKNPSQGGSLANQILQVNNKIESFFKIDDIWLTGKAEDLPITHNSNDLYTYKYNLGIAPEGYKFLLGIPYINWFSSNLYFNIEFKNRVFTKMSGDFNLWVTEDGISGSIVLAVFSCIRVFVKL